MLFGVEEKLKMWVKQILKKDKNNKRRSRRLLLQKNTAVYHVVSKTAYHDFRFDDGHKTMFRQMLERQAQFCGVEVISFCILDNHFHLLVRIPHLKNPLKDDELIRRYKALYAGRPLPKSAIPVPDVIEILNENGSAAKALRKQLQARMGSLPIFIKELKQRFSIWYNNHFDNVGTNWCEPFKSVLVEDLPSVLKLVSAYIDLNPVRAGICENPEDYPFSTIGEAKAGNSSARKALKALYMSKNWDSVERKYLYLLSKDQPTRPDKSLNAHDVHDILGTRLHTPIGLLLRERLKIFSSGGVIGSSDFVKQIESFLRKHSSTKKQFNPKPIYTQEQGGCKFHSLYLMPVPLTY